MASDCTLPAVLPPPSTPHPSSCQPALWRGPEAQLGERRTHTCPQGRHAGTKWECAPEHAQAHSRAMNRAAKCITGGTCQQPATGAPGTDMSVPRPLPENAGKDVIHPGGCLKVAQAVVGTDQRKVRGGQESDRRGERDTHGLARRKAPGCGCSTAAGRDTISKGAVCWAPGWQAAACGGGPRREHRVVSALWGWRAAPCFRSPCLLP